MICKNCGSENEDGRKFCKSCGAKLEYSKLDKDKERISSRNKNNTRTSRRIDMKNINKNKEKASLKKDMDLITIGTIFAAMLLFALIAIIFSYFMSLSKGKVKSDDLSNEAKNQSKIEEKLQEKEKLYQKAIKDGGAYIKNGEYAQAIKVLSAIPESSGNYYKEAEKSLLEIEDKITNKLETYMDEKNYEKADELSKLALKIFPKSKKISQINKDLDGKIEKNTALNLEKENKENEEVKETTNTKNDIVNLSTKQKEALRQSNAYGKNGNPKYTDIYKEDDFLNKKVKINAAMGEVRTEPNLNSGVAGYVNDGESVYVKEVYNDGGRYWLKIDSGWISSKLITGEFR